jgi:hypothetical protein
VTAQQSVDMSSIVHRCVMILVGIFSRQNRKRFRWDSSEPKKVSVGIHSQKSKNRKIANRSITMKIKENY